MKDPCQSKMVSWPRSGRLVALTVALAALSGVAGAVPAASDAKDAPFNAPLPPRLLRKTSPAWRSANLSPAQCRAELARRKIAVKRAGRPAPGVATPVRLAGTLSGVRFTTPSGKSPYGILDCRLVLALEAFAQTLARHDVVEARIDNL